MLIERERGGTDLLPNMKLGQTRVGHLVSAKFLTELHGITRTDTHLRIGIPLGGSLLSEKLASDDMVIFECSGRVQEALHDFCL